MCLGKNDNGDQMNEMKNKIVNTARELFFRQGYKRTVVDEIAHDSGISKKTIYNHFINKRDLLVEVIKKNMESIISAMESIAYARELPVLERIEQLVEYGGEELVKREQVFFDDIMKNEPDLAKRYIPLLYVKLRTIIKDLLEEAKKNDLLRKDVNMEVLPYVFIDMLEGFLQIFREEQGKLFPLPVEPELLFREMIQITFYGIMKGHI